MAETLTLEVTVSGVAVSMGNVMPSTPPPGAAGGASLSRDLRCERASSESVGSRSALD
jgi:hypothetical protein